MAQDDLFLDTSIRNWVLWPITVTMILVGVLRHYVTLLMNSPPKKQPLKAVREQRALLRGQILRTNANYLTRSEFESRKATLAQGYESGTFLKEPPSDDPSQPNVPPNPLGDPAQMDTMMDGLKKQMVMFVPQTVIMGWINLFFTGFILIKLPFPLTLRFKSMLQRGIDTPDMDVTWVSSLSWYFLNLFGLNSVYRLILGEENAADGTRDMQAMGNIGGAMAAGPVAQDFGKLFAAERENLELVEHAYVNNDVEARYLRRYGYDVAS